MTTIGTAVLQIIPSLKGVTDAIEKQIDGKVVEVKVAPKVDTAAAKKAGKDAGDAIATEAKVAVRKGDVGKAVAEEVKTSVKKAAPGKEIGKVIADDVKESVKKATPGKDIAKAVAEDVKKSTPGRDIAKVIFEGLAEGVRQGLPEGGVSGSLGDNIVDDITDSVKSAAKNSKIGSVLGGEFTGGLIDNLSKSLRDGGIGKTITDALNSVGADLSGPVQALAGSLDPLKTALGSFGTGDAAGGLSAIATAIKGFEGVGVPPVVASSLDDLSGAVETMTSGGKANAVKGLADGFLAMAPAVKDLTGVDLGGLTDGVETISSTAGGVAEAALALGALKTAVVALGGGAVLGALSSFAAAAAPVLGPLGVAAGLVALGKNSQNTQGVKDPNSGLPATQGNSPAANSRDRGDVPTTINGIPIAQAQAPAGTRESGGVPVFIDPKLLPKKATGGPVSGAGTAVSDSILARLSNGEFVVNADATRKNMPLLEIINSGKIPGFAGGGQVDVDALKQYAAGITGGKYVRGGPPGLTGTDCSGAQAAIANFITGGSGRFATSGEAYALASRGFQAGDPPPGIPAYWVGWVNGGPGGGHTSGTIVDPTGGNVNVEMGGSSGGGAYGGPAGGAARFANRAWIAIAGKPDPKTPVGGEDPKTPNDFSAGDSGSAGGGFGPLPSSISGLSSFGLSGLGKGVGTTTSGSDLGLFGNAASTAVSGQVSSALGVFGVGDSPPFLQAATKLIGGLKVGGHATTADGRLSGVSDGSLFNGANPLGSLGGQSASPLSASGAGGGAPLPDSGIMHGARAGQPAGPQTIYNISTAQIPDAFNEARRREDVRTAARLDRY